MRVIVNNAFQGCIFVFGLYGISYVFHVACTFVLASDGNLLGILQVVLGDAGDFGAHGCREEQGVPFFGDIGKDSVDAVGESHIQHFVRFVHHYVVNSR